VRRRVGTFPHGWKRDHACLTDGGLRLALGDARVVGDIQIEVLSTGAGDLGYLAGVDPHVAGRFRVPARGLDRACGLFLGVFALPLRRRTGAIYRVNKRFRVVNAVLFPAPAARECEDQRQAQSPRS
jgi:hypothetical protein